ncbi:RICIN domain-containing protein [Streptomyces sp. NPDC047434]|uniref:RICIN domain-containing protein n=2 Tax=unclassified Streptomyces TaxID=2593676 RepID=UPI0033E96F71
MWTKKIIRTVTTFLAVFAALTVFNAPTASAAVTLNGRLNAQGGFKCATPEGNRTSNGTVIAVWWCTGSNMQRFHWLTSGELYHWESGKCVTPRGNAAGTNGTVLTLWDCTGSSVQEWQVYDSQNRPARTVSSGGKCITGYGNSVETGTYLTLWTCASDWPVAQDWGIDPFTPHD